MPGFFDPLPKGNAAARGWSDDQLRIWHRGEGKGTNIPWGTLGYAQVADAQTGITTEADLTGLTVTATIPAGRRIRVTFFGVISMDTVNAAARLRIYRDSTQVSLAALRVNTSSAVGESLECISVEAPAAGTYTWKATLEALSNIAALRAASGVPAGFLVEDIGPA